MRPLGDHHRSRRLCCRGSRRRPACGWHLSQGAAGRSRQRSQGIRCRSRQRSQGSRCPRRHRTLRRRHRRRWCARMRGTRHQGWLLPSPGGRGCGACCGRGVASARGCRLLCRSPRIPWSGCGLRPRRQARGRSVGRHSAGGSVGCGCRRRLRSQRLQLLGRSLGTVQLNSKGKQSHRFAANRPKPLASCRRLGSSKERYQTGARCTLAHRKTVQS